MQSGYLQEAKISGGGLCLHLVNSQQCGARIAFFGPDDAYETSGLEPPAVVPAGPDVPPGTSLLAMGGAGYSGTGILDAFVQASGQIVTLQSWGFVLEGSDEVVAVAGNRDLGLVYRLRLLLKGGALEIDAELSHSGEQAIAVERCASALLPLPDWGCGVEAGYGSWSREGYSALLPLQPGAVERSQRLGRPGFGGPPCLSVFDSPKADEVQRAIRVHLAWSGSCRLRAERLADGLSELVAEAVFDPGEILLRRGDRLELPGVVVLISHSGFEGLALASHNYVRHIRSTSVRPVHFNTWEACYFNFDEQRLKTLAAEAAALGAERFVLDDGWFVGRNDDTTSLGDWTPDPVKLPGGLGPVIDEVERLGMSFGLWVEPEMVSQNSQLFRDHPEWVLGYPGDFLPTGRHQLVLNLGIEAAREHVFTMLSKLLSCGRIEYIKWDSNRELYPATYDGRAAGYRHIEGVHKLLARVRGTFPGVEIESCASGGGRMDFGMLRYVHRYWPSDATDPVDRARVQSSVLQHFPPELIGTHVGASPNGLTGRQTSMSFRVLVALFGHMGLELDPGRLSDKERETLASGIAIYRRFRGLLHSGRLIVQKTHDPNLNCDLIVSSGGDGLLRVLRTGMNAWPRHPRVAVRGLDSAAKYLVTRLSLSRGDDRILGTFTGASLAWTGLAADPGRPQSGSLFHLKKC